MNLKLETLIETLIEKEKPKLDMTQGLQGKIYATGAIDAYQNILLLLNNQQSTELNIAAVSVSLPEHKCKYCGAMTTQPDEICYANPNRQ